MCNIFAILLSYRQNKYDMVRQLIENTFGFPNNDDEREGKVDGDRMKYYYYYLLVL